MTDDNDPNTIRSIRARKYVDSRFVVFVIALLAIGAIGAGLVYYTHVEPGVETEEETVATWQESTSHTHQAEVRNIDPDGVPEHVYLVSNGYPLPEVRLSCVRITLLS